MTVFALGNSDPGFAHKSSTIKETIAFSVVGDLASCLNNTTAYLDDRNRRCTCYKGELLLCHLIRKDFKTMNFKERYRFVRGLRTAATNPIYKEEYRRLCKLHSRTQARSFTTCLRYFYHGSDGICLYLKTSFDKSTAG